ncbi:MAG: hypothetical protein CVU08_09005 [Bacteroidetes bacterium HGW-Bacteroidetes-3]|jgi:hypothetical protein|nr:MAG: hypothetical protein CVU08_09005 [Bacteroidetes bacterium HGW-Bacteroidetes-3]
MKLEDYNLPSWKEGKFRRQKRIDKYRILLLSIDRTVPPPREGRKNLIAVDEFDNIIWIADLPTEIYDSYYEMKYKDGVIYGRSSNSHIAEIDPITGKILKKYMVR